MKRSLLAVAVVAVLAAGCATNTPPAPVTQIKDKLEQKPDIAKAEAEFLESMGTLQLQFSEDGDWVMIKTTGTAPINFNHGQGREDAFMLATMRAKRNLIEFLTNDVKSIKTTDSLTKTSLRDLVTSKNDERRNRQKDPDAEESGPEGSQYSEEERKRANRIAQSVTESITDQSQYILRGAYIAKREISRDSNMVAVTIQVSKKSINASGTVRSMMSGL